MTLLDLSFGFFAFLPQGWLFMAFVILAEALIMSKYLAKKFFNHKIYIVALISNFISGLIGIIASLVITGGWWLIVWFPWVSSHEVDVHNPTNLMWFIIYYLVALILSVAIEAAINHFRLRKQFSGKKIFKATLWANAFTYLVGAIIICILFI
ncbi:MAG: hypothetical protein J5784_05395 [Muribaculaceae bacterium]|nr:hypothetical protein [Muribaculaceae bacterium]